MGNICGIFRPRRRNRGCRPEAYATNEVQPMFFSPVHGENIHISRNGTVAQRSGSFCKGIVFSGRPVKVNEKICMKFIGVSSIWSGVLRLGFSSVDPMTLKHNLPKYVCPDLTSRPGFWAKAFTDYLVKKDAIVYYYVNSAGDVHFGINGEEKGIFMSGVDTRGKLWALIDIYGNSTAIEFVDPNAHLNNSRGTISEGNESSCNNSVVGSPITELGEMFNSSMSLSRTLTVQQIYPDVKFGNMWFHKTTGKNVEIVPGLRACANRKRCEYYNAYAFTSRPVVPGELIVVQVEEHDDSYTGSLTFGLTSCDPKSLTSELLPDFCHMLYDRPEYWVMKKSCAGQPVSGDFIAFEVTNSGEVLIRKNREAPRVLMHVDPTVPLWAFFDLYGTTQKLVLCGNVPPATNSGAVSTSSCSHNGNTPSRSVVNCETSNSVVSCKSTSQVNVLPTAIYEPISVANYQRNIESRPHAANNRARSSSRDRSRHNSAKVVNSENTATPDNSASSSVSMGRTVCLSDSKRSNGSTCSNSDSSNWLVECVACCEVAVDSVFYPCGHMCMCYKCAMEYWKRNQKGFCPICRHLVTDVIRTYKS